MRSIVRIAACSMLVGTIALPLPGAAAGSIPASSAKLLHTYRKTFAHEVINTIPVDANKVLPLVPDEYDFVPAAAVGLGSADQAVVVIGNFQGSYPQIDDQAPGTEDQVAIDLLVLVQQPALAAAAGLDIPGAYHVYALAIYTNDAPYAASLQEADFPVKLVPGLVYDRQINDDTGVGNLTVEVPADDSPFYSLNTANGYAPSGPLNTVFWYNGEHGTAALQFIDDPTDLGQALSVIYTEPGSSLNELLDGGGLGPGPTDPVTGFKSVTAPSLNYRYHDVSFGRLMLFVPEPNSACLLAFGLAALLTTRHTRLRAGLLTPHRSSTAGLLVSLSLLVSPSPAKADIFQWEYTNAADPSQGKRQSTLLAPDGAGVDAVPGASLYQRDLTMAYLGRADLTGVYGFFANLTHADLRHANLTNADFTGATLTDADFANAAVQGSSFNKYYGGTGTTLTQLYSTASYQAHDLKRINLDGHNLNGVLFAGQDLSNASFGSAALTQADFRDANLTNANFGAASGGMCVINVCASPPSATLIGADFTGAQVQRANFATTGITPAQLYSTASYQVHDLSGIILSNNDLVGGNFAGQNLSTARFDYAILEATDFSKANLSNVDFSFAVITDADFRHANLTNANLGRTDLTRAILRQANLVNANFSNGYGYCRWSPSGCNAALTNADLTEADARGASGLNVADAISTNLIRPDGHIDGLELDAGEPLVVRDYDGNPLDAQPTWIPITVDQHLSMGPTGTLRMVFETDAWDSTISFAPDIPVALGGTLELTFANDVEVATQVGRTFDLFDWTGITPTGAFAVSSQYIWDLSNLYTTGELTLLAVPEPATLALTALGLLGLVMHSRRASPRIDSSSKNNEGPHAETQRRGGVGVERSSLRPQRLCVSLFSLLAIASATRADIFQWEYINPADPSQGKRKSTTLAPDGAGADAVRGANLSNRDLTKAHLIGADLTPLSLPPRCSLCPPRQRISSLSGTNLTDADLTSANLGGAILNDAVLVGAQVRGTSFRATITFSGTPIGGISLPQLYSTASYQARDLNGINLGADYHPDVRPFRPNYAGAKFENQNLQDASFRWTDLTGANFRQANLINADFGLATLTDADFAEAELRGANFNKTPDGTGITLEQLYSAASFQARDLSEISLGDHDLTGGNFAGQNLSNASFAEATLTGANFTGAHVRGANFSRHFSGTGLTLEQLYSSASYQAHDLSRIGLYGNDLSGGDFAGQNLTDASFEAATLTDANFTGAHVRGANFQQYSNIGTGITLSQLYSTASYQGHDLTEIHLGGSDLTGANFAGQNLTNASLSLATLTGADFAGAEVRGASFDGLSLPQLYTTASYQAGDLSGIELSYHDLTGGNFAGQNLTNANFGAATLSNADFREAILNNAIFLAYRISSETGICFTCGPNYDYATLTDADLTAADARGATGLDVSNAKTTNLILPDGRIDGMDLSVGGRLVVRDYDDDVRNGQVLPPIPISVDQHLAMAPGSTLRMVFEADAWDSTISFAPGIPISLGGTLELTFADDVDLASQVGRTFDLFDWTGVTPTGAFAVSSQFTWDLSNLYTTGKVTLTAVPEPAAPISLAPTLMFASRLGSSRRRPSHLAPRRPRFWGTIRISIRKAWFTASESEKYSRTSGASRTAPSSSLKC